VCFIISVSRSYGLFFLRSCKNKETIDDHNDTEIEYGESDGIFYLILLCLVELIFKLQTASSKKKGIWIFF